MGERVAKEDRRKAELLAEIKSGAISSWREAMDLHLDTSWDLLRRALKALRDEGLIATGPEYTAIRALGQG